MSRAQTAFLTPLPGSMATVLAMLDGLHPKERNLVSTTVGTMHLLRLGTCIGPGGIQNTLLCSEWYFLDRFSVTFGKGQR